MNNVIICSDLNPEVLPKGERWLVIGPLCWGVSRSLPFALKNAAAEVSYGGGQFTARVIPDGELSIDNDGSYGVKDWTPDQQARAKASVRIVAVTKSAAQRWGANAKALLSAHTKELKA